MKPTTRQIALFKGAPREYVNLSIKPPVVAAYYIDEGFHTTWVVRSKTKFQDFDGKNGLRFTISDYQFKLSEVESVSSSELVDFFGETGGAVDLILGQDFINVYSFLFYKRNNDGLQLSKSCINRTIWPDKPNTSLEIYTAAHLTSAKGGVAVYTNICTPFNIWRPYKPSYWDPREDIGLFAMIVALRIVNQMPASETAPTIKLITSDKATWERFSPFMKIKRRELEASQEFQQLKLLPMKQNVMLFLEYRKSYADRNCLDELTCVGVDFDGIPEYMGYAKELAKLGSKMSQLHFKGELPSEPNDDQYYHFDNHKDVFVVPKKEANNTIKRILETYQDYTSPIEGPRVMTKSSANNVPSKPSPTGRSYGKGDLTPIKVPVSIVPYAEQEVHIADEIKASASPQPFNSGLKISEPTEIAGNPLFSQITSTFNRMITGEIPVSERTSTTEEIRARLQKVVLNETDQALQIIDRQRRMCDSIMARAYQKYDKSIEVLQKVGNLQGYLEGFFDGLESRGNTQDVKNNLSQKISSLFINDGNAEIESSSAPVVKCEENPAMQLSTSANPEAADAHDSCKKSPTVDKAPVKSENQILKEDEGPRAANSVHSTPKAGTRDSFHGSMFESGSETSYEGDTEIDDYRESEESSENLSESEDERNTPLLKQYNLRSRAPGRYSSLPIPKLGQLPEYHSDKNINLQPIATQENDEASDNSQDSLMGDITAEQWAEMTTVTGCGGVEGSLEKPIISLVQALVASADLRERLSSLLDLAGVDIDIHKTSKGLKCAYKGYPLSESSGSTDGSYTDLGSFSGSDCFY